MNHHQQGKRIRIFDKNAIAFPIICILIIGFIGATSIFFLINARFLYVNSKN